MTSLGQIIMMVLNFAYFLVIAHVIMHWLLNFQVLNARQPLIAQLWYGINRILEPLYAPIRRLIPPMGGLDLTPIVLLFGIHALRIIVVNNF